MTAVITVAGPATEDEVTSLVRACSPESLRLRFMLGGPPDAERILLLYRSYLLAGTTLVAKAGDVPIGLLNLVPDDVRRADLGILVADAWHRRGVASALVRHAWREARWLGWTVHATVQEGNTPAEGLLRRHGFRLVPVFERGERDFELVVTASLANVVKEVVDGGEAGQGTDGVQRRAAAEDAGGRRHRHAGRGRARRCTAGLAPALLPPG
jgi:GNAT superfamily N-acetyltransferase